MAVDANDKQTLLLLAVKDKLETVALLETVCIGRLEHLNVCRPAAGIIPVMDDEKRASKLHNTSDFDMLIRVLVDEDEQEEDVNAGKAGIQLGMTVFAVKQAMKNDGDRTWGGLCVDFFPGPTHWLYVDQQLPRAGADIEYKFHYQL